MAVGGRLYIKGTVIKRKAKELGYRTDKSFMHTMDVVIEVLIKRSAEWTKPKKTITGLQLAAYLANRGIKLDT